MRLPRSVLPHGPTELTTEDLTEPLSLDSLRDRLQEQYGDASLLDAQMGRKLLAAQDAELEWGVIDEPDPQSGLADDSDSVKSEPHSDSDPAAQTDTGAMSESEDDARAMFVFYILILEWNPGAGRWRRRRNLRRVPTTEQAGGVPGPYFGHFDHVPCVL